MCVCLRAVASPELTVWAALSPQVCGEDGPQWSPGAGGGGGEGAEHSPAHRQHREERHGLHAAPGPHTGPVSALERPLPSVLQHHRLRGRGRGREAEGEGGRVNHITGHTVIHTHIYIYTHTHTGRKQNQSLEGGRLVNDCF